jgi:hypothetical protein
MPGLAPLAVPECATARRTGRAEARALQRGRVSIDPLFTVTTSRIKDGRVDECMRVNREIAHLVEEHEPRMIAFHVFLNVAEDEVVGVQVHPDADSMASISRS